MSALEVRLSRFAWAVAGGLLTFLIGTVAWTRYPSPMFAPPLSLVEHPAFGPTATVAIIAAVVLLLASRAERAFRLEVALVSVVAALSLFALVWPRIREAVESVLA